jgi:hypothetical protein
MRCKSLTTAAVNVRLLALLRDEAGGWKCSSGSLMPRLSLRSCTYGPMHSGVDNLRIRDRKCRKCCQCFAHASHACRMASKPTCRTKYCVSLSNLFLCCQQSAASMLGLSHTTATKVAARSKLALGLHRTPRIRSRSFSNFCLVILMSHKHHLSIS